jgi:hypothetical protein
VYGEVVEKTRAVVFVSLWDEQKSQQTGQTSEPRVRKVRLRSEGEGAKVQPGNF